MTSTRKHLCVYFDDGGPEQLCVCGARALLVLDEDGASVLVQLVDETAPVTTLVTTRRSQDRELAVSA